MAKLTRVTGKVFGGSAPLAEIGQFGSAKEGTPTNTQDVATIQALSAYANGWGSAIISPRNFPPIEEVTGVLKTISYQTCYLLQEGLPVYDIGTEYYQGSIVKSVSGRELSFYISLVDNNIGNPVSDDTKWAKAVVSDTSLVGVPIISLDFTSVNPPANCLWLDGSEKSRTTYSTLFGIYGITYGAGDGSTTFNLPNFNDRTLWGGNSAGYIAAGLPNIKGAFKTVSNGTKEDAFNKWTADSGSDNADFAAGGGWGQHGKIEFNAHSYNSLYKDSVTTVQPPAIKFRAYTRYQ